MKALDVSGLLAASSSRIVVVCGSGGVGKTTTSAALALRAAESGRRVVVLTIDPAKRLAQALGVAELDNTPQRVDLGPGAGGELYAMMLNMRRTFDEMVLEHSTPERARAILDNPFYQTVATSFSGTQEYMAMEKLGQLARDGRWDLVIVDTPPSRNALDFLDAPERLGNFLDGRLFRLFTAPGRGLGRVLTGAMGLAIKAVSAVVGGQLLSDASAFVASLDSIFGSFRERAARTYQLLKAPSTRFVVISAAEGDSLREATYFVNRLSDDAMPLAGLVFNRVHPALAEVAAGAGAAERARAGGHELAAGVLAIHDARTTLSERERRLQIGFSRSHPDVPVAQVPWLAVPVTDVAGLRAMADALAG